MKHVYFRLNQTTYEWGRGWTLSKEALAEWKEELAKLFIMLSAYGFVRKYKNIQSASDEVINPETGETIYFHPMDYSGYLKEETIRKVEGIIKAFKSKYWTWRGTDIYEIRADDHHKPEQEIARHKLYAGAKQTLDGFVRYVHEKTGQDLTQQVHEYYFETGRLPSLYP